MWGFHDHFGQLLNFLESRLESSLRGEAVAANNEVELLLDFVRKLTVDGR
jgi:hypothetical protein